MKSYTVAVVGALGLVGSTMIRILEEYDFPVGQLKALEHRSLTGAPVAFKGQLIYTEEARPEAFDSIDIALFATGEEVSSVLAPEAARRGAVAIDNSRHFRLDPNVPLVTPEVNPEDLDWHKGIIANPNCTTVASILSYKVLHSLSPIRRIVASSYQSSSGGSLRGMMELRKQSLDMAAGYPISPPAAFRYPLAFNLIPFIDAFEGPEGYTREEWKMVHETRRMLHDDTIAITCTCIRVPTLICHAVSLNVETAEHVSAERFREACAAQPGLKVVDDIENLEFPQPLKVAGGNEIHIGRIREDISCRNALNYYVVADNVRKGAAQNAVQIAQELIKRGLL